MKPIAIFDLGRNDKIFRTWSCVLPFKGSPGMKLFIMSNTQIFRIFYFLTNHPTLAIAAFRWLYPFPEQLHIAPANVCPQCLHPISLVRRYGRILKKASFDLYIKTAAETQLSRLKSAFFILKGKKEKVERLFKGLHLTATIWIWFAMAVDFLVLFDTLWCTHDCLIVFWTAKAFWLWERAKHVAEVVQLISEWCV